MKYPPQRAHCRLSTLKMLTYCILKKNDSKGELKVVETGFSFLGFVFGPLWAIFKSLWFYSAFGIVILLSSILALETLSLSPIFYLVSLISSIFWGVFARDLYIQDLINREFYPVKHVTAKSRENAIIKYLAEAN